MLFFVLSAMFFPWMFPLFSFLYLKVVAAMMFGHVLSRNAVLAELFFFFFFRILTDQSMTTRFNAGSNLALHVSSQPK